MKEENKDTIELNEEEIRYIDDESTKGYYEKLRENIKKKLYFHTILGVKIIRPTFMYAPKKKCPKSF